MLRLIFKNNFEGKKWWEEDCFSVLQVNACNVLCKIFGVKLVFEKSAKIEIDVDLGLDLGIQFN